MISKLDLSLDLEVVREFDKISDLEMTPDLEMIPDLEKILDLEKIVNQGTNADLLRKITCHISEVLGTCLATDCFGIVAGGRQLGRTEPRLVSELTPDLLIRPLASARGTTRGPEVVIVAIPPISVRVAIARILVPVLAT